MVIKKIPSKQITDILTKEIKEFCLPHAKEHSTPSIYTKAIFDKLEIPKSIEDLERIAFSTGTYELERRNVSDYLEEVKDILGAHQCTNAIFYAANSCMPWHTNSDNPGKRIYIIYTQTPGIFRYKNPHTNEIVDDIDYVGWTQREFVVDKDNLLWHSVYSPGARFSFGFNVKNDN
jgi:hypothetical protein